MQHARDRVRELTARSRLRVAVEDIVRHVNRFLAAGRATSANSAQFFDKITRYALARPAAFVAKRHKQRTRFGWWVIAYQSPNRPGLIDLNGIVVPPRANRPWRPGPERRR